jgi:trehalose/maltose hydrolase-like predicted phosphorylase
LGLGALTDPRRSDDMVDPLSERPEQSSELPAACTDDHEWIIVEEGFTPEREHELESLFAIGNGYVGSRGSLAEGSALSAPATFVAGVFDSEAGFAPVLAPSADWTRLSAAIDGQPLRLDRGRNLEHRRVLDMRQGILWREWRHLDDAGRITRVKALRLASLADRHLLVQCVTITPENYSERVSIDATLRGPAAQLTSGGTTVAMAMARRITDRTGRWTPSEEVVEGRQSIELRLGETRRLDRIVALHTSRDTGDPRETARIHAESAIEDVADVIGKHRKAWRARWDASDLRIKGDPAAQRALRFAIYHLLSAANPQDDRVSIGARGLSGVAYKGHVFWDTDIFMLPFFIVTYPEAARALVMYRYRTLAAARAKAARLGYRGAYYAWESADSGEEVTPPFGVAPNGEVVRFLTGEQEQHISADVGLRRVELLASYRRQSVSAGRGSRNSN